MVGTARKNTKRSGEVGRNRRGGKATAETKSLRAAANLAKLLVVKPVYNEAHDVWLCPTCEVSVTEVDLSIGECTCCGQKLGA